MKLNPIENFFNTVIINDHDFCTVSMMMLHPYSNER